jgi:hypothetical protein
MEERQPFEYSDIHYNEVIMYLEKKWGRALNAHEKHVLIEGYRFGRYVEADHEISTLWRWEKQV